MIFFRWIPVLLLFFISSVIYGSEPTDEKIKIEVGESKIIEIKDSFRVKLSRKGLVDLRYSSQNKWRLTGLKPGFVMISYENSAKPEEKDEQILFVEVVKSLHEIDLPPLPANLCNRPHIQCNQTTRTLTGAVQDVQTLNHVNQICEKEKDCLSQVTLSTPGQIRFQNYLKARINQDYRIQVYDTGHASVVIPCPANSGPPSHIEKTLDRVTGQLITKGFVTLSCEGQTQKTQYHLDSKVIIVDESSANSSGFRTQLNELLTEMVSGKVEPWKDLESFFTTHKGKVIGDASLLLQSNKEATVKSGGEIPVIVERGQDGHEHSKRQTKWKEHGLKLQVTAFPVAPQITNLKYTLNVTEPISDDSFRMQLNTLDSEIEMSLNKPQIVGGVEYKVSKSNEGGVPILSKIPIISPIFRLAGHHEAKMMLFVWFYLKEEKV